MVPISPYPYTQLRYMTMSEIRRTAVYKSLRMHINIPISLNKTDLCKLISEHYYSRHPVIVDIEYDRKVREVLGMAIQEMARYGLYDWRFDFARGYTFAGECDYTRRTIRLSRYIVDHAIATNSMRSVKDTILHEIAHALVGPTVKAHGSEWQAVVTAIGGTADIYSDFSLDIYAGKGCCAGYWSGEDTAMDKTIRYSPCDWDI